MGQVQMSCLGRVVKLFTLKLKVGQTENPKAAIAWWW